VTDPDEPCLGCVATPPAQAATVVWGDYDGPLRTVVLAMKRRGRDELAGPIGLRLAARLALEPWAAEVDLITHVPSHPIRRLRNGWSAAACTARVVAREIALPARPCLRRHGLARQTGRSRAQRLRLPARAFSASAAVRGRRLLVVDDVTTTGTTLRRAARAARQAGCRAVYCAVIARAPEPRRAT
jgi:predicted amidophosphoribosyltransferase